MHVMLVNPRSFLGHEIAFVQDEVGLIELYEHMLTRSSINVGLVKHQCWIGQASRRSNLPIET